LSLTTYGGQQWQTAIDYGGQDYHQQQMAANNGGQQQAAAD